MKTSRRWIALAFVVSAMMAAPLFAQKTSGTITGQVTDPSGAAVAKATVVLINTSIGVNRSVMTNDQGEYTFDDVQVGTYEVDIKSSSFRQAVTKGVIVNVSTTTRSDAHLAAGDVSEIVTVSATAVQVQTDSGALGTIVDGTQVKELPLNGRSFVELTQLGPGVSAANNFDSKNKGLQGGVDFSVNGNPTTNNLFLVDGANDNDVGSNRTILIYPSIESIAEFKMLTNSYGPEYGQASGAIVSIVTRSGTNTFHGSAFYDGRNDALAAYSYFAKRNAGQGQPLDGKDKLRRNDWGYSVGGPIKRDKLFFFFNQEWNHEIRGFTQSACVASAAERAGDFSLAQGVDGNGNPVMSCNETQPTFPLALAKGGNVHILNNIDPAGALLEQYYPLPNKPLNGTGGNNWSQSLPTFLKYRQENVRGDYNLTKRNTVMGRYTQDTWTNPSYNGNQYWGDSPFPVINGNWAQPSKMAIGRWTSTTSDSLVNDAEFAYSNNRINITPGGTNPGLLNQLSSAIPSLYPQSLKTAPAGTPTVWGGLGNYGSNNTIWSIAPWNNTLDIYTIRDDVSKIAGKHAFKFGAFLGYDGKNEDSGPASSERPSLGGFGDGSVVTPSTLNPQYPTGVRTGNTLANALVPNNPFFLGESSTNVRAQLRWRDYEFYAGDTWKIRSNVTLNLGARYSLLRNPVAANDQATSFQPKFYDPTKPVSDACNGLMHVPGKDPCGDANKKFGTSFSSGVDGPNRSLINNNNHLIAPRIGVAWDVFGNGSTAIRAGGGQFFQRERVSRYVLENNAPFSLGISNYPRALSAPTPATLGAGGNPSGGIDPAALLPTSYQWNLTVEQSVAKNTVMQMSYVGNRGMHLTSSYDVNGIPQSSWTAATFGGGGNVNSFRPYHYGTTLGYFSHNGDSNYHSLQTLFRTQINAFRFQAAYTWSHAIADIVTDDSGGGTGSQSFTNYLNPRLDRGNSATNRPNIFVANATYLAPKLDNHNLVTRETLGGWELTGITQADSGNSFTIFQNGIGENTGNLVSANAPGAGNLSALFQTGLTGNQRPLKNGSCSANIKGDQVINPNAVTLIGYHLGTLDPNTAPRGYCQGPRLVSTDFSVDKNWKAGERVTVQFRLDAFDLFNHANFRADQGNFNLASNVNCGAGVPFNSNGTVTTRYAPCSATNNVVSTFTPGQNFGKSTGLVGNAGRQIQYGLHVEF